MCETNMFDLATANTQLATRASWNLQRAGAFSSSMDQKKITGEMEWPELIWSWSGALCKMSWSKLNKLWTKTR